MQTFAVSLIPSSRNRSSSIDCSVIEKHGTGFFKGYSMLFQINPVLILVPVKTIQSIAPPYVYDIIILYLLAAVHRIVRFESEIKSKSSAYNGLGTQNEFLNHAPLTGLRLISELNAAHGLHPKREEPY